MHGLSAVGTKRGRAPAKDTTPKRSSLPPSDLSTDMQLPHDAANDSFPLNVTPKQPQSSGNCDGRDASAAVFVGPWHWEPLVVSSDPARDLAAELKSLRQRH